MVARDAPDNESVRLELQEAIATLRHWTSQVTQAAGFIATGDILLLSYGFSQKLAAILDECEFAALEGRGCHNHALLSGAGAAGLGAAGLLGPGQPGNHNFAAPGGGQYESFE